MASKTDCVIVGAGVTGLTAAFYLKKKGVDFLVLEEKERTGGVIQTLREEGFLYETGPNTGVLGRPEAALLFEDLGDAVQAEIAGSSVKKRYILKNGKWEPLPSGLIQAVRTPLFSRKDKFRILGEPFRQRGSNPDENLKEMVHRRMGKSYLDYAVDPFILGVYAGDPDTLIPRHALPKLYNLEQTYGSFIGGAIKKRFREKPTETEKKATRDVFSVRGGLQALVDALHEESGTENFRLGCREVRIAREGDGYALSWISGSGEPQACNAPQVVVTTGSHKLPGLLPDIDGRTMESLTDLRYAPVIEVAAGFKRWQGMTPDGFGGLIPFREKRDLLGVLFPSAFLKGRAPEGGALFTVFMGGIRRPELFELDDQQVFETVRREFTGLMGIERFEPDLFRIFRYRRAIPQYERSSGERFSAVDRIENGFSGLLLRGNFRGGIGLADRIRQGRMAAGQINAGV